MRCVLTSVLLLLQCSGGAPAVLLLPFLRLRRLRWAHRRLLLLLLPFLRLRRLRRLRWAHRLLRYLLRAIRRYYRCYYRCYYRRRLLAENKYGCVHCSSISTCGCDLVLP
jgi:hypothetical protein